MIVPYHTITEREVLRTRKTSLHPIRFKISNLTNVLAGYFSLFRIVLKFKQ